MQLKTQLEIAFLISIVILLANAKSYEVKIRRIYNYDYQWSILCIEF